MDMKEHSVGASLRYALSEFHPIDIGFLASESHRLIELVGCYALGVGGEHQRRDALRFRELDGVGYQQLAEALSAESFIHHYVFYPGLASRGAMIDAYGQHPGCLLVLHQEEQVAVGRGQKLAEHLFGECHRIRSELVEEALHGFVVFRRIRLDFNYFCHGD